jgi:uncharacterized Ntn-hydrolase superfamily protein
MIAADESREIRQLAVLGPLGHAAAYTGRRCIPRCGHIVGEGYSVQANTMVSDEVWPVMARAFEDSEGPLAERMVTALEAAEGAGGDLRGSQSAAVLVVQGRATGRPWEDRVIDLRVEDHPHPVEELHRLLEVHRAYQEMNDGDAALERGDMEVALRHYGAARERYPQNEEMKFWQAVMLVNNGRWEEALPLFRETFAKNARWRDALPDLVRLDHLRLGQEQLDLLMIL